MAFSKTPIQDTEQTKIVPLMHTWNTRNISNTYDTDNVNVVLEPVNNQLTGDQYFQVIKRDGTVEFTVITTPESEIFGAYYWTRTASTLLPPVYVTVGAFGVRGYNPDGTTAFFDPTGFLQDKLIGFTEFLYENGDNSLIICDSTKIYELSDIGIVSTITGNPATFEPYPVFLDGYVFLAELGTGNVFNSNLNDPNTWSASNVITAESYPDVIHALGRSGQYIVAFGATSIQFFYDAANPTGSPLAPQTTTIQIGYIGGLVAYRDELYFLGAPTNGNAGLYRISGLKAELVSEVAFTRWLNSETGNVRLNGTSAVNGHILAMNGHVLYTSSNLQTSPQTPDFTYALDLDTKLWVKLIYQSGTKFNVRTSVVATAGNQGLRGMVTFDGGLKMYEFSRSAYRDDGVNFPVSFTTPNMDFGTYRKKFGSRIMLHSDQTATSSNCFISWTDDDYQTYSTPRALNMAGQYKQIFRLGSFRKRAFKLTYSDNFPMRWEYMELDYSQGSS